MTTRIDRNLCVAIVCVAIVTASALAGTGPASAQDAVAEWNEIMQATVAVPPSNPLVQARWGAIVQLAVFEAVNSITGDYEPYLGIIEAPPGASAEAAAVAAAHAALVGLRPESAAVLDPLREASLTAIPDGPEKEAGILVGEEAAAAMLVLREGDGSDAVVPYTPGTAPGDWRPTPTAFAPAFLPGWGLVTPFGLEAGSQFRLPPPPPLTSRRYAIDYDEVRLLGRIDSPARPRHRTDVARFYAASNPVQLWNPAARQASVAQGRTLSENARTFALLGMAMCDASIAIWDSKYHHSFWRPQTAIRAGDADGNGRTESDAGWVPLIGNPSYPSYASGYAAISGAARVVLEHHFGQDGHDVVLTTPSLPDMALRYTAWSQIADDIDDARIYGGVHFRFDQDAGRSQGRKVGRYILRNYLRSADELDDSDGDE